MAAAVGCEPCVGVFCMSPLHTAAVMSASLLYFFVPPLPLPPFPIIQTLKCVYNRNYIQLNDSEFFCFVFRLLDDGLNYILIWWMKSNPSICHTHLKCSISPVWGLILRPTDVTILLWGWSIRCGGFTQCCLTASWNIMTSIGSVPK